jgi:hypothetical protein
MAKIPIILKSNEIGTIEGEIDTDINPETANGIISTLPLEASGNRWGEEIYFSIPFRGGEENSSEVVEKGDLAYWPPGNAFCIFFGRTPASSGDEIRPASSVNVFGRVLGDLEKLKTFPSGSRITIERAD